MSTSANKDNRSYYDDFAGWYEKERHHGYHAMLDKLQIGIAKPLSLGKDVLEIGCGTGLILKEVAPFAGHAVGVDISRGMLEQAQRRGLEVVEGSATALPFSDGSFDSIFSFKVLAHVEDIRAAMREVARVLRPGGRAALEFYNPRSIRGLIKRFKRSNAVSDTANDHDVYTRYDTLEDVTSYLPPELNVVDVKGVRVFTPFAQVHKIPVVASLLTVVETVARDQPITAQFAGFLVVIVERD